MNLLPNTRQLQERQWLWRLAMNCVEEQRLAREAAYNAQYYVEHGQLGYAMQMQREARDHAAQAMKRLERLI